MSYPNQRRNNNIPAHLLPQSLLDPRSQPSSSSSQNYDSGFQNDQHAPIQHDSPDYPSQQYFSQSQMPPPPPQPQQPPPQPQSNYVPHDAPITYPNDPYYGQAGANGSSSSLVYDQANYPSYKRVESYSSQDSSRRNPNPGPTGSLPYPVYSSTESFSDQQHQLQQQQQQQQQQYSQQQHQMRRGAPRGHSANQQPQNYPPGAPQNYPMYQSNSQPHPVLPPQPQNYHQQPQQPQMSPTLENGRRIVSSPSLPNYNATTQYPNYPNTATSPIEARTRSLSSASLRPGQGSSSSLPSTHSQGTSGPMQQRMQSIPQGQPQQSLPGHMQSQPQPSQQSQQSYQNHRPGSSGSGSNASSQHTFSLSSAKSRSFSSLGKLSSLSTKKYNSSASLQQQRNERQPSSASIASTKTVVPAPKRPVVYPALLSRVAKAFKESVILSINTKDGLEYHDTFTGKMAVDILSRIIRTNDRNLALLLGRSLDAQKFFRDVTYNHRLRDSVNEVYAFNHVYSEVEFFQDDMSNGGANGSKHGSIGEINNGNGSNGQLQQYIHQSILQQQLPSHTSGYPPLPSTPVETTGFHDSSNSSLHNVQSLQQQQQHSQHQHQHQQIPQGNGVNPASAAAATGVNGVFSILTDCYSPTCTRNKLCYSIACPRRLEQQARLNLKPQGGLQRAVSRLSLHDNETNKTLWHETVDQSVLDKLDKKEKMRQELIYEFIYTERDYVKDLEFMTDFYIMPLRNPANNIIPEREREAFIRTVFGGVSDLLRLAKAMSEALTKRQQQQKPVIETFADVFLEFVGNFDPFIKYSGNKVFASFEHERQQQVNMKYARFLDAIEKKPESRKQDLSSFLIKGVQRPARYQLLLGGIIKNTKEESPDYKNLIKAKEKIEKVLVKINIQTGESTDRHKIMVLHRLLGKQTLEERFNFKLSYNNRIIYQVTLNRKRDNEKIDLYLFEHALLLVKHKIQNKREIHKVFEKPIYLPLLFVNTGYDIPTVRSVLPFRIDGSIVSDTGLKNRTESTSTYINAVSSSAPKLQINYLGLGKSQVHATLFADDVTNQNQVLQQIYAQQKKMIEKHDIFSLSKYETRRFHGNNKINCAVPCYGGKKLLYGTDSGVWVSTVRSISATSNEKICSDPTLVISKLYVSQIEVLVEYSKLLILSDKTLYEFDLSCTDSLDHMKNTRSGKLILSHVSFFKTGICDGRLLVCAVKTGSTHSISIVEPTNPFDQRNNKNKNKKSYDIREIVFSSDPVSISFLKTKLCIGCTKGFEILSLEAGKKESILDEADPSLDFATQRESVTPLAIHRLDTNFLLSYSEFSFLINGNGWRTNHDWGIFWEGTPQNIALFYPYLLAFEPTFIEIRDLESTSLLRALVGENIRFLHSNEHEALYACEENGYDIIVSIDFLNLKPKPKPKTK